MNKQTKNTENKKNLETLAMVSQKKPKQKGAL